MMILEPWSSYNHKQFPLITNSPFKDKPRNLQIIYTFRLGMNGTWLGSFIWISFSLYILTESANYMATSEYSQSSLKISISKRLCAMTVIEELDLRKEENPLYWTVNHLLKADTSRQPQLEYNTYLGKLILTIIHHQILGLHHREPHIMKESLFAKNSTGKKVARETFVDSNTSALHAALNPMANLPVTNYKISRHNHNSHQNPIRTPQNTSFHQITSYAFLLINKTNSI